VRDEIAIQLLFSPSGGCGDSLWSDIRHITEASIEAVAQASVLARVPPSAWDCDRDYPLLARTFAMLVFHCRGCWEMWSRESRHRAAKGPTAISSEGR
jgi:hypothetical protein